MEYPGNKNMVKKNRNGRKTHYKKNAMGLNMIVLVFLLVVSSDIIDH